MKFRALAAAAALSLMAGNANAAELLINGGFETPGVPNSCCSTVNAPGSFSGWTVPTGDINLVIGTYASSNGNLAFEGTQYLDLIGQSGSGSLSQSFATVAGQSYYLSFAYSHNLFAGLGSASGSFTVGDLADSVTHSSGSTANLNWQSYGAWFTATGPTTTLTFVNTAGGGNDGLFLDAVSVTAVPEPATWAMMIGGFGLMGGLMRRRKAGTLAAA